MRPPKMPVAFWEVKDMRDALATWHMGRILTAHRHHPFHGRILPQDLVAGWFGITQAQLSRIENGPAIKDLDKLAQWARILSIPPELLWFQLPDRRTAGHLRHTAHSAEEDHEPAAARRQPEGREIDDMNRRELLRLMSIAGAAVPAPDIDQLDWDRVGHAGDRPRLVDHATLNQYEAINAHLWRAFTSAVSKVTVLPLVQQQLGMLTTSLQSSGREMIHRRLYRLVSDLFQLQGEILFDGNHYTEAAHCYTLAATAGREARAFDLWACALTRHAYIGVYEREFRNASPVLDLAATIAQRGDSALSTRHWVHTVRANALAGLGDLTACEHALERAEGVHELTGEVHNGGWLRFDGSRLPEERGACYVELRRPDLAEDTLTAALRQDLSVRRRGGVRTALAMVAAQRRDLDQLVTHANAALDAARQSHSGVVGRRLQHLQTQLQPYIADQHVRHVSEQITAVTTAPS